VAGRQLGILKGRTAGREKCVNVPICVNVQNVRVNGQTVAQIWRFSIFSDSGRRRLGFLKFRIFEGRQNQVEGQNCVTTPNLTAIGRTVAEI